MLVEPHTVPSLLAIRPRYWLLLDAVAGAGYGVLTFVVLANEATGAGGWLAALVGAGCLGGPIWSRRRMPICALAVLLGATAVLAIVHPPGVVMALPPLVLTLYAVAAQ